MLRRSLVATTLFLCAAASARAQVTIDFNGDASSLTDNFTQVLTGNNTPTSSLTWGAAVGSDASGGVSITDDITAIYTPLVIDATSLSSSFTMSIVFMTPASVASNPGANAVAMLGLSGANNTGFGGTGSNVFLGTRVRHASSGNKYYLQMQTRTAAGTLTQTPASDGAATSTITLSASTWYRLVLDLSTGSAANTFDYTASIFNLGGDGTGVPASISGATIAGTMTNADLAADQTAFAAFRGVSGQHIVALDNFSVIPEPSSFAALAGVVGLGVAASRRCRA